MMPRSYSGVDIRSYLSVDTIRSKKLYFNLLCVLFQAEKTKITKRKNGKENNAWS